MIGLTKRQRDLLDYLSGFIAERGYCPTFKQMGAGIGLQGNGHSNAAVARLLDGLEERGCIRRLRNRRCAIQLIDRPCFINGHPYRFIPMEGR